MTIAGELAHKLIREEVEGERRRDMVMQFWSLSRPGVLLLSGWLGTRAAFLLPSALAGTLSQALIVGGVVFVIYVAWERLGHRLAGVARADW